MKRNVKIIIFFAMMIIIIAIVFIYLKRTDSSKTSNDIIVNPFNELSNYAALKKDLEKLKVSIDLISVNFDKEVLNWVADDTTKTQLEKDIANLIIEYTDYIEKLTNLDILNDEWEKYRESLLDLMNSKVDFMNEYNDEVKKNSDKIKKLSYFHSIENKYMEKINEFFRKFINEIEDYS